MDKLFLDADVVLDYLLDRKPYSDPISEILSLGDLKQVRLFSSVLVFANCYYVLRKLASHPKVIDSLTALTVFIDFVSLGKNEILDALHSSFKDFEDALQNSAATNGGMAILLTRNTKDYKQSELAVMTPEEYVTTKK